MTQRRDLQQLLTLHEAPAPGPCVLTADQQDTVALGGRRAIAATPDASAQIQVRSRDRGLPHLSGQSSPQRGSRPLVGSQIHSTACPHTMLCSWLRSSPPDAMLRRRWRGPSPRGTWAPITPPRLGRRTGEPTPATLSARRAQASRPQVGLLAVGSGSSGAGAMLICH